MRKYYKVTMVDKVMEEATNKVANLPEGLPYNAIVKLDNSLALVKVDIETTAQDSEIIALGGIAVTEANVNTEAKALQITLTDAEIDIWKLN